MNRSILKPWFYLKRLWASMGKKLKGFLATVLALLIGSTYAFDPNDQVVYKETWDSTHYLQEDGSVNAEYQIGWIHYLDANGQWQDIDTTLKKNGEFYEMTKAPFTVKVPTLSTGTATFISNNRWDNLNSEEIPDTPLTMNLTAEGVAEVPAKIESGDFGFGKTDYIVYPNAYPEIKGDLIYWVNSFPNPELKKLIRINENPGVQEDLKLCFDTGFNKAIDLKEGEVPKEGKIITEEKIEITPDGKDGPRKIILDKAYIWHEWNDLLVPDGEDDIVVESDRQEVTLELDSQSLCKILPKTYLDKADYPVYSDATLSFTPSPGTADGYSYWGNLAGELWTTARNAAAVSTSNTQTFMTAGLYSNGALNEWENFWRAKVIFNTASIDDTAVINSVQIVGSISTAANNFNDKIGISSATTASSTVVAIGDYPVANCGATPFSGGIAIAVGDFSENLNASGVSHVSKTGYTKFCLNSLADITNTEPTWAGNRGGYVQMASSEGAGITLVVNYGPVQNPKKIMILQ